MGRKTKVNRTTSPELIEKINPKNKRLCKDFLLYLRAVQRSEETIPKYKSDLDIFFVWLLQNADNKEFKDVSKRDRIAFQNWLLYDCENSPARIRRLKACLSSLSNYIENILDDEPEFKTFKNIINKVENPINEPVREKSIFTEEELNKLLDYLVENKKYQKACVLALSMASGRRKAELCRFKVNYFDDKNIIFGSLYKTPEKIKTKGRGVNGKPLDCYCLVKKFKPYLDLWLKEREKLGIDSEYLFVVESEEDNTKWVQIKQTTLTSWANSFTRYLRKLGINKTFYFHSMRHYFTTALAKANIPDSVIQSIVGWASADLVRVYDDRTTDSQISKYFNEDGIKEVEQGSLDKL